MKRSLGILVSLALVWSCGDDSSATDAGLQDTRSGVDVGVVDPPDDSCGSVRLTSYEVFARGWCEWETDRPFLPTFVRNGLTAAIAEPWNGSSYGGEPGEGCGECWEIDTINGTEVVMVADLCPREGNPLCSGAHFHLDLTNAAAAAVGGGALDEGSARRVACPVDGAMHVLVNDDNVTYLRIAIMNHRIPVRSIEFRGAGDGVDADNEWTPAQRSGGAWEIIGGDRPTDRGGSGVQLRLTSAQGQVVESSVIVPSHPEQGSTFSLEVQFDDLMPSSGGSCDYQLPGDVYVNGWGGIEGSTWQLNPWGQAEMGFFGETNDGCFEGSCIELATVGQFDGFHLYYRQPFPVDEFRRVTLRARVREGVGELVVGASNDGERCAGQVRQSVGTDWVDIEVDLASTCSLERLNAITVDSGGEATVALLLDDVRFLRD